MGDALIVLGCIFILWVLFSLAYEELHYRNEKRAARLKVEIEAIVNRRITELSRPGGLLYRREDRRNDQR